MEELKEKFVEWTNFVTTREAARAELSAPVAALELKTQINDKKAELLKVKAELQMLQAQLVLSNDGKPRYSKPAFDLEWTQKKIALKAEVEKLMAEQIESGMSIPRILKELQSRNPAWLYQVKENLDAYRGASKEEMANAHWFWTDVTSVHRYGLAHNETGSEWGFVLMHGAVDSEFEHEKCMFEFGSGLFVGGNRQLFDSVSNGVKHQRSHMLAELLDGTYTKKVRRDTNPYFTAE